MTKDQIRAIFLGAGFTIKEGQTDLRPYVYDAAYCLLSASIADTAGARIERLRKGLFEARDAMRVMSNWSKKSDPAGYGWAVRMVDRANAVLNHEPEIAAPPAPSVADTAGAKRPPVDPIEEEIFRTMGAGEAAKYRNALGDASLAAPVAYLVTIGGRPTLQFNSVDPDLLAKGNTCVPLFENQSKYMLDSARYRWLRDSATEGDWKELGEFYSGGKLDAEIDEAIAKESRK